MTVYFLLQLTKTGQTIRARFQTGAATQCLHAHWTGVRLAEFGLWAKLAVRVERVARRAAKLADDDTRTTRAVARLDAFLRDGRARATNGEDHARQDDDVAEPKDADDERVANTTDVEAQVDPFAAPLTNSDDHADHPRDHTTGTGETIALRLLGEDRIRLQSLDLTRIEKGADGVRSVAASAARLFKRATAPRPGPKPNDSVSRRTQSSPTRSLSLLQRLTGCHHGPVAAAFAKAEFAAAIVLGSTVVLHVALLAVPLFVIYALDVAPLETPANTHLDAVAALTTALVMTAAVAAIVRQRIAARIGAEIVARLRPETLAAEQSAPCNDDDVGDEFQAATPLATLHAMEHALSSRNLITAMNAVAAPFYLFTATLLAPTVGLSAIVVLAALTWAITWATLHFSRPEVGSSDSLPETLASLRTTRRNATLAPDNTITSDGEAEANQATRARLRTSDRAATIAIALAAVTFAGVMAAAISGTVTAPSAPLGLTFALMLLVAAASWTLLPFASRAKHLFSARAAANSLSDALDLCDAQSNRQRTLARDGVDRAQNTRHTQPHEEATVLSVSAFGVYDNADRDQALLSGISFSLTAGKILALVGASGSGKSILLQGLAGRRQTTSGDIRLLNWSASETAQTQLSMPQHIGAVRLLPQHGAARRGTVGENISGFCRAVRHDDIIAAARTAGLHGVVAAWPKGYDTHLGRGGMTLSAGETQLLLLAAALYGNPPLILLDEPESHLDGAGETALIAALTSARQRGQSVIVATQRRSIVALSDDLLVLDRGRQLAFGPTAKLLPDLAPSNAGTTVPVAGALTSPLSHSSDGLKQKGLSA